MANFDKETQKNWNNYIYDKKKRKRSFFFGHRENRLPFCVVLGTFEREITEK